MCEKEKALSPRSQAVWRKLRGVAGGGSCGAGRPPRQPRGQAKVRAQTFLLGLGALGIRRRRP